MTAITSPFYQVGIIVAALEPAMAELSAGLGITWGDIAIASTARNDPLRVLRGGPTPHRADRGR